MTDFGAQNRSWGGAWNGQDPSSAGDPGLGRIRRIINGYVTGSEIRTWPGWRTAVDPVPDPGQLRQGVFQDGYRAAVIDCQRPVARRTTTADAFPLRIAYSEAMRVWADPANLHCFVKLKGRHLLIGESKLRVEPVFATGGVVPAEILWWTQNGSGRAVLHLSVAPNPSDVFGTLRVGSMCFVDQLVDSNTTGMAQLNGRMHVVLSIAGQDVELQTTVTGSSVSVALQGVIGRCRGNRSGLTGSLPYAALPQEASMDPDALTVWWIDDPIDPNQDVVQRVSAAYVANRRRDFADRAYGFARNTGVTSRGVEGHQPNALIALTPPRDWGVTRRPTRELTGRLVPALAGDRVLLAARDYACMFQVPLQVPVSSDLALHPLDGAVDPHNSIYDIPRCLGVPKGVLIDYQHPGTGYGRATPFVLSVGNGTLFGQGTYRIAVAYRDDATGETGLLSEQWVFTLPAPGAGNSWQIFVDIMHPGYVMAECLAMSVLLFMSRVNEDSLNFVGVFQLEDQNTAFSGGVPIAGASQSSAYGLDVFATHTTPVAGAAFVDPVNVFYRFQLPGTLAPSAPNYNKAYDNNVEVPTIRQMPRGSKFVSVTRGAMLSGGAVGTIGLDRELMPGKFNSSFDHTVADDDPRELFDRWITGEGLAAEAVPWPTGNGKLPPSYSGSPIFSPNMWPYPIDRLTLDFMKNCRGVSYGTARQKQERMWAQPWDVQENPHRFDGDRIDNLNQTVWLQQFRGFVQTSELDQFGVTSATSTVVVDAKRDDDIEAGAEFNGTQILCTRRQTFALMWSVAPGGSTPVTVSNEFGCVAPNSMVECAQMLAWMSHYGPVAYYNGMLARIGAPIARYFNGDTARFLHDRNGMMLHSWAAHDMQRGLLLFGVFENRLAGTPQEVQVYHRGQTHLWDAAADEVRARFPCDVVLAYHYASGAWSEWHPPAGLEVLWMGQLDCADGLARMGFLAADKRLYVLDDEFGDTNRDTLVLTVASISTGQTVEVNESIGSLHANRNGSGSFVRANSEALIYGQDNVLKARVGCSVYDATHLALSQAVTVAVGDRIMCMPRTMVIETASTNPKGTTPLSIDSVTLRGQPRSVVTSRVTEGSRHPVWATATITKMEHPSGRHGGGQDLLRTKSMTANPLGDLIASSEPQGLNRVARLSGGKSDGFEQRVTVEVFGGAQFCLQDLIVGQA